MYEKVCKSCGRLLSEFYHTGMLGCPDCYKWFASEINASLKNVQGATVHVGKAPKVSSVDRELLFEYKLLLKQREKASIEERFDDVKEISAQIYELQQELKNRGLI